MMAGISATDDVGDNRDEECYCKGFLPLILAGQRTG
jgi:hypothetical protein